MELTREIRVRLTDSADAYTRRTANSWSGWPDVDVIAAFIVVRATVEGPKDPATGYVCDVKTIDKALRESVAACVGQHSPKTSYAAFAAQLWTTLREHEQFASALSAMEIAYSPYMRIRKTQEEPQMVTITQQYEFSAAHRLHCDHLSADENRELFGKCNNPNGHGHNYVVDVELKCEQSTAGRALALAEMDATVKRLVIDRFDHKHLNQDTDDFKQSNPTVENIGSLIFDLLKEQFQDAQLTRVRVYETPKTWVDVTS